MDSPGYTYSDFALAIGVVATAWRTGAKSRPACCQRSFVKERDFAASENLDQGSFVKGHNFSRANKPNGMNWAFSGCEKLDEEGFVKGHDFSRANNLNGINGALAPAASSSANFPPNRPFPPACSAPAVSTSVNFPANRGLYAAYSVMPKPPMSGKGFQPMGYASRRSRKRFGDIDPSVTSG